MRAAPADLVATDTQQAFALGCDLAAITHGHPSGYLPAGVPAAAVHLLVDGSSLDAALDAALVELDRHRGHEETTAALEAARELAARGRPTPETLECLGARDGATAVPTAWRDELELHEVIEQLAEQLTRADVRVS